MPWRLRSFPSSLEPPGLLAGTRGLRMDELFDQLYAPGRYYRLAADDIRQSITRQVVTARSEVERGLRAPDDPWAALDLIDVVGVPDAGIFVFFRLPQTADRINVYVADVRSVADLQQARALIAAGHDASLALGEGYDVFDEHFIFAFPDFARHSGDVKSVSKRDFFAVGPAVSPGETVSRPAGDMNGTER